MRNDDCAICCRDNPNPEADLQRCYDMHLTKRIGKPDELGRPIVVVGGDKADFMMGRFLWIDEGSETTIVGSKKE